MTTPAPLCAAVEVALNRYLALDEAATAELEALRGRTLALHVEPPDWWLVLDFMGDRVRVAGAPEGTPEVAVHGAPRVYLRLFGEQLQRGAQAIPRGLRVEGDPELLQRFRDLVATIGFDLAEILEPYLGDVAAQRVADAAGTLLDWARHGVDALAQQGSAWLRFERGDVAGRDEVEEFIDATDALRDDAARLEARIARLERRRSGTRQ